MTEIFGDPIKTAMLIILIAMEIPAIIILAVWWAKAWKDAKEGSKEE